MADPTAATITQLRNIQARTGMDIASLHAAAAASGATRHGERRSWLMEHFQLGYGDANAVALFFNKPLPDLGAGPLVTTAPAPVAEPLVAIYSGAKAGLRPLHDAVMAQIKTFGAFDEAPKKGYISLRRKKQFAMLGPATKDCIEIGLNAKNLPVHPRLKAQPPGSMCNATTRVTSETEVDGPLIGWLRQAYDAAG